MFKNYLGTPYRAFKANISHNCISMIGLDWQPEYLFSFLRSACKNTNVTTTTFFKEARNIYGCLYTHFTRSWLWHRSGIWQHRLSQTISQALSLSLAILRSVRQSKLAIPAISSQLNSWIPDFRRVQFYFLKGERTIEQTVYFCCLRHYDDLN